MTRYEAFVFDVSDTLVEYCPNYAQIFGDRLRSIGFEISNDKANEISKAINWAIGEQNLKEQHGAPYLLEAELNELLDKTALSCVTNENNYNQQHLNKLKKMQMPKQKMLIISDVIRVLEFLKLKYRLAIVSNHYAWLMDYLTTSGLAPYFESIIISDIVGVAKPNVRIMQIVLDELALNPKSCLYIGDQPMDVLCAKQIGMDCAWIATKDCILPKSIPYKEDYRIARLSELLNIL